MLARTLTVALVLVGGSSFVREELPTALPNDNRVPAGTLHDGILSITLEAQRTMWYPNGDSLPAVQVEAFGEAGRKPQAPGPLLRVPAATEIQATVRNTLERDTLTFFVPNAISGRTGVDSVVVAPGGSAELRVKATVPGNYTYRATTQKSLDRLLRVSGILTGGIVVDSASSTAAPRDRVFVLMLALDSLTLDADGNPSFGRFNFAINGRSWPRTERLSVTVGDTLHWRVLNANFDTHPMHLHGFYYRVDALAGPVVAAQGQGAPGRMVVTERLSSFATMSMTWVPERAGNWLFHCHFQLHVAPPGANARVPGGPHENHATQGMAGLVLGIAVHPRPGERIAEPAPSRRKLRLIATQDPAFPDSAPSMRFVAEEVGHPRLDAGPGWSPTVYLTRGEPVSITVVNRLPEPTSVHWHGIELESYYDGVAGFGGWGARLAPVIAPGDSFEARFTPPRAGTFIYHSHVNEPRQHRAGMGGALIVRDLAGADSSEDRVLFLKSARIRTPGAAPIDVNGQANPDTLSFERGHRYRLRFIGLTVVNPSATVFITARPDSSFPNLRDSLLVQWRPLAKDGADLPEAARALRPARQIVSIGETFDFEFVPGQPGVLRLEVRGAGPNGRLLARVPLKVR